MTDEERRALGQFLFSIIFSIMCVTIEAVAAYKGGITGVIGVLGIYVINIVTGTKFLNDKKKGEKENEK